MTYQKLTGHLKIAPFSFFSTLAFGRLQFEKICRAEIRHPIRIPAEIQLVPSEVGLMPAMAYHVATLVQTNSSYFYLGWPLSSALPSVADR